jgi:predicted choloylglycine hydrolase
MYHLKLSGSYYQMGLTIASRVYRTGFRLPEQPAQKVEIGMESEKIVKDFFPEFLEELKGFAEGCHNSYEQVTAFILGVADMGSLPNCSVFAARNSADVIFGRNYDYITDFKKTTMSTFTIPENGFRHIGQADIFIGREDGINEKGLAVGMASVSPKTVKPGISFLVACRYVLEKCASVAEGVKALLKIQYFSANNILLADKSGDMAVVETSAERVRVRRPGKGDSFIICTNHFLYPDMQEMEDMKLRATEALETLERYDAIYTALKKSGRDINVEKAQKVLSDHKGYVCCHHPEVKIGTLWSIVSALGEPRIYRAEGSPCRAKYKPDSRLK